MFEQRLQQRLHVLLVAPIALILMVAVSAVLNGNSPGAKPRELVFDLYQRIAARPDVENSDIVIIDIDQESLDNVGPWPWPRTTIASLVTSAENAGASSVIVTVPVDGPDPLSPEVVTGFWENVDGSEDALRAIAQLPTNNAALAAASAVSNAALGVGKSPAVSTGWERADLSLAPWMSLPDGDGTEYLAVPAAPVFDQIDAGLSETALVAINSLPQDPDGIVRRSPLLWGIENKMTPSVGLAAAVLEHDDVRILPSDGRLRAEGAPADRIVFGDRNLPLDRRSGVSIWFPRELDFATLPAWRALEGGETWTRPIADKTVFIGQSITDSAYQETARGRLNTTLIQAHLTEQVLSGHVPFRPTWSGYIEALIAVLFGTAAIALTLYAQRRMTMAFGFVATLLSVFGTFLLFQRSTLLFDPVPAIAAAVGAPLAILLTVVGDMLLRDDAVRGQFHGALPRRTMSKLQSRGSTLLRGVRREVTVLSCGLRLPPSVTERFENRPDDFIRFTAAANDRLRRTILDHDGTVDYAEDGRLLGYWNVPEEVGNPIEKACACALKMIDDVNTLSENVQTAAFAGELAGGTMEAGAAEGSLEIGIANTACFAGPVGRGSRNRYAVIGDAVRLATALRQRARQYGPAIITDDVIFGMLRHQYAFLDLDVVRTNDGDPVRTVYGLVGNPFLKASKAFRQLADTQRELVLSWRNQDLPATTVQLQRLRGIPGVPDVYIDLYDRRLAKVRNVEGENDNSAHAEVLTL